ncbi:MAG: ThiF family adenylyltransferase [Deltaproteobacteria bacterium]|nr:ThiF family adenylyltransferase [Deltaproteobacteria bacterium]
MRTEEEIIQQTINDFNEGQELGRKLVYDKTTGSIRAKSALDDPDSVIDITPEMFKFGSEDLQDNGAIVISGELFEKMGQMARPCNVHFESWDNGDVYNLLTENPSSNAVPGTLYFAESGKSIPASSIGKPNDVVRIIIKKARSKQKNFSRRNKLAKNVAGYIKNEKEWKSARVEIIPIKDELYSRNKGLIESDAVAGKSVALWGLGSHGSRIALHLGNSGLGALYAMDHDRYEVGNISRHVAGIPHVGRKKTNILNQLLKEINPYITVRTFEEKVEWANSEKVRDIIRKVDLVICTTDSLESRLVINTLCVQENTICIFAGAFRRAYGVQIIRVRPWESLCYQCFRMWVQEQASDQEISNRNQAERLAYTDRPVPVEPGLSIDIAPVTSMVVKLAIQELLKGTETTLRSLDDDLVAPWYLWLNRREAGTQFENIEPLEYNLDGLHILRWYGINVPRHPECPVCGNFDEQLAKRAGISLPLLTD